VKLQERIRHHELALDRINGVAADTGAEMTLRGEMAKAVHEQAITALEIEASKAFDDDEEMRIFRENLAVVDRLIDRHQEMIEKAHHGQAPWGEILAAGKSLQDAVKRLRGEH
jgi:hypothetical protein